MQELAREDEYSPPTSPTVISMPYPEHPTIVVVVRLSESASQVLIDRTMADLTELHFAGLVADVVASLTLAEPECTISIITDSPSLYVDACALITDCIVATVRDLRCNHNASGNFDPFTGLFYVSRGDGCVPRFGIIELRTPESPFVVKPVAEEFPRACAYQEVRRWAKMLSGNHGPKESLPLDHEEVEQIERLTRYLDLQDDSGNPLEAVANMHAGVADDADDPMVRQAFANLRFLDTIAGVSEPSPSAVAVACRRTQRLNLAGLNVDQMFQRRRDRREPGNTFATMGPLTRLSYHEHLANSLLKATEATISQIKQRAGNYNGKATGLQLVGTNIDNLLHIYALLNAADLPDGLGGYLANTLHAAEEIHVERACYTPFVLVDSPSPDLAAAFIRSVIKWGHTMAMASGGQATCLRELDNGGATFHFPLDEEGKVGWGHNWVAISGMRGLVCIWKDGRLLTMRISDRSQSL
ncbi:hypothetical protein QKT49_gp067 [Acanthamoeba castellanii medusavirus]|uniref:Uncharacterized protein n=1 Tax=Acanthamoeba castellanii medusavirus J1 TaxID=3114988 RepID=A0A3T1CWJ7_9VIRU|nr:hypothetical protein QKT49_gp067 [Acanthamoeba castellanii medusavirus]BBI30207.1 hypothetical protein [Acanthamoeba castellanii medusavirus J1]